MHLQSRTKVYAETASIDRATSSDDEVKSDFKTRQVYKMPVNARMFILERMENQDNNERHDVVKELTEKNITIEHIMPQTLSDKWKTALGDDWERIHEQYLHTLANLTLTGKRVRKNYRMCLCGFGLCLQHHLNR